ncbi:MAG: hypothetical protein PHD02_01960 [Bacilli bacterium]|nr:hypothetical protein [Bacilli bacterium]
MPSIASHIACATYIKDKANIKNENDFYKGNIYPDLVCRGHFYERYFSYYIPDIDKFLKKYKNENRDFYLGYLCHLLLDRYFVTQYVSKKIRHKDVKRIYNDYSLINNNILNKWNFDFSYVNLFFDFDDKRVCKDAVFKNKRYLYLKSNKDPSVLDYLDFEKFLSKAFDQIFTDLIKYGFLDR